MDTMPSPEMPTQSDAVKSATVPAPEVATSDYATQGEALMIAYRKSILAMRDDSLPNTEFMAAPQAYLLAQSALLSHLRSNPHAPALEPDQTRVHADVDRLRALDGNVIEQQATRIQTLESLLNQPHTADFISAVEFEAGHQRLRWDASHDAAKQPADWFWLLGYLSGKALSGFVGGDNDKALHHIISSAAVLLNWHRQEAGKSSSNSQTV